MKRSTLLVGLIGVVLVALAACGTFISPSDAAGANDTFDAGRNQIVSDLTASQVELGKAQAIAATQPANSQAAKQVEADQAIVNAHSTALANYDKLAPVIKKTFNAATQPSADNIQAGGSALGGLVATFNPGAGGGIVLGTALLAAIVRAFQNGKKADTATQQVVETKAQATEAQQQADTNATAMKQLGAAVGTALATLKLPADQLKAVTAAIDAGALAGHAASNDFMDGVTSQTQQPNIPN